MENLTKTEEIMENLTFGQTLLFVLLTFLFLAALFAIIIGTWFLLESFIYNERATTLVLVPITLFYIAIIIWGIDKAPDNLWIF